jgi:hypothetical protein
MGSADKVTPAKEREPQRIVWIGPQSPPFGSRQNFVVGLFVRQSQALQVMDNISRPDLRRRDDRQANNLVDVAPEVRSKILNCPPILWAGEQDAATGDGEARSPQIQNPTDILASTIRDDEEPNVSAERLQPLWKAGNRHHFDLTTGKLLSAGLFLPVV